MSADERRRPLAASGWTLPRVLAAAAALLVLAVWVSSGSLVMALLVLVLVAGTVGLGVLLFSWATRGPRPSGGQVPDVHPTADLDHVPGPADRIRRAVRGLLARPWVRGDALVRAATARLASEDALVFTPRGQRVAAPHLWVEWNPADLTEVADRWPLEVLARELADGYLDRAREQGVRRLADRTWVHLLAGADVPIGRVVVTAAFSRPQQAPAASASSPDDGAASALPAPAPRQQVAPPPDTTAVTTTRVPSRPSHPSHPSRPSHPPRPARAGETASAVWRRVVPVMRTVRARRPPVTPAPRTVGVLVAETPRTDDVVLAGPDGATVALGRDPRADAVVEHPGVSWRHLTVTRRDATSWTVTDAGSTNGTRVGEQRIAAPTTVRAGDVIGLGQDGPRYRLALRTTGGDEPDGARAPTGTRVEVA